MRVWWQLTEQWLKQHWRMSLLALFLALSTVMAGVGLLAVAGWFLTGAFLAGSTLLFNLFAPSALVRGLSMWRIASRYAERVVGHQVTLGLQAELRTQSFAQLASYTPAQLAAFKDGDVVARLLSDIERLDLLFLLIIAPAFTAVIAGGFFSLIMGSYLPALGWGLLVVLFLASALLPYGLALRTAAIGEQVQTHNAQLRAFTHEAISAHTDLLVFNQKNQALKQFEEASSQVATAQKKMAYAGNNGTLLQQLLMGAWVLAVLWIGVHATVNQQLSAPVWVAMLLGTMGLFEVIAPLMRGAANLGAVQAAAKRVQHLHLQKPHQVSSQAIENMPHHGTLSLNDVCLAYDQRTVFDGLSLHLDQGMHIAISGPSGVGKTSLLLAIMQIQPLQRGRVCYGGIDLANVAPTDLYQQFSFLTQHAPVFMGTIRHNLCLAKPEASDEELWHVLEQVHLAEQIREMGGLHTWVGEGGNTLSTGQIRRLSLARTVLSNASVWLLDEPTSGLDKATADAWFLNLKKVAQGRTVIIVTHADLPAGVVSHHYTLQKDQLISLKNSWS